jgi:hypothetical protein
MSTLQITLTYRGNFAEENQIDLYDAAQALVGFQRSLALTTHLILNDEIITQAPSLEGAQILALPSQDGSWKQTAKIIVVGGALYNLGTVPKDTPLGNLISSAYDYVISETLGFHVDYNKTLRQQYDDLKKQNKAIKPLSQSRFDSLVEKCEVPVRDMHRPITKSETATEATITAKDGSATRRIGPPLTFETYEYVAHTDRSSTLFEFVGRVSSYNINTFKGRVYVADEGRPVPFELAETARNIESIVAVTTSLQANAKRRATDVSSEIQFNAFRNTSRSGRLKSLFITEIL